MAAGDQYGTTIVTFLMVFLIQNTQNREGLALQAKLDELICATQEANNRLVAVERLPEEEVETIREVVYERANSGGQSRPIRSSENGPPPQPLE
jgi:low affinity Fe/Cu permease